ncbi:uncharacterized protein LOC133285518 [Gastrolobium bilobum]|uniref:uncharacterized protein LOC133285518 n=1 Tax=Gastrolobium bilobum TaxID=150636 RepID=UPI002AB19E09|nr:uncharacterized protein LOC133285518 [Gastrolobium bilobum]
MEQDRRVELIDLAIQKFIHDNRNNDKESQSHHNHNLSDHDAEYQLALSHLLSVSQLETLERDEILKLSEASNPSELLASVVEQIGSEKVDGGCRGSESDDEIIKELKKVKRQNFVTHCLLSVMIVLTVAWQLSEVSLILKVKNGLSNPFRFFGSMIKGMLKVSDKNGQEHDNKEHPPESSSLPSLKVPEMPHMDISSLGLHNGKQ